MLGSHFHSRFILNGRCKVWLMALTNFQLIIAFVLHSFHTVSSDCGGSKADIVFILDSSGSVDFEDFQKTKEFFKTMVGGFQIGSNKVRMASVPFSTATHNTFELSDYTSEYSLKQKISNIPYDAGGTNTHLALKYARETSFSYWNSRSGVAKIAVVITDGQSNNKIETLKEAEKLRNSGVIIFSVGVGDGVDRSELSGMASRSSYVFDVATFSALDSIRDRLTKTACEVISCGDPGTPLNGDRSGSDFSKGKSVSYSCHSDYKLVGSSTRTCQSTSVWSGSLPRCVFNNACKSNPCHNKATCNNGQTYTCSCAQGYSGFNCEKDIQPPVVKNCPSDIREFSVSRFKNITWRGPSFYDPHEHYVDVTTNYPKNGSTFFWGDYTAIYTAVKQYNGLRSVCTFNINVRPHPCPDLNVTIVTRNGALVCNGWMTEYTRICMVFCNQRTKLQEGHDFRTKYICGGSGKWLPSKTLPFCGGRGRKLGRILPSDEFYYFQKCVDEEKDKLREKYLEILKKSSLQGLCNNYPDLCKKENVDVQCK